jgi:hypothetical protein
VETEKVASVIVQVVDPSLSRGDRDLIVRDLIYDIRELALTIPGNLIPLTDQPNSDQLYGVQIRFAEPENIAVLLHALSDRLEVEPLELRLTIILQRVKLQVQTASAEELAGFVPTLDMLLPAHQTFQARAELYAQRGGDLSPVEQANLELLRYRLNLTPDLAEAIIARALGPYRNRQEKLDKYREVLSAELERQTYPLEVNTRAELKRLAQSLGLSYDDVAAIEQEYVTRIQAEAELLQQKEEQTKLQMQTLLQAEEEQRKTASQQSFSDRYRQEFAAAIATTLYPSEFDRGRLEQARRTWEIDPEQVRAIERELIDERYGAIDSASGVDYTRLRQLLWLNQWELADQETERMILLALSQDMQPLGQSAILKLNCVDLQTLDLLWSRYSQGKFGFLAQHQVFLQKEGQVDDFLMSIGWSNSVAVGPLQMPQRHKPYRDLKFSLNAPLGHLPTWRWTAQSLEENDELDAEMVRHFFTDLVEKCLPGLKSSVATTLVDEVPNTP